MIHQMNKLRSLLNAKGIDWEDMSVHDAYPIDRTHFDYRGYHWSVIHGFGSYGGWSTWREDEGLLELMSNGVNNGDPIGWLTAKEVMAYVKGEVSE